MRDCNLFRLELLLTMDVQEPSSTAFTDKMDIEEDRDTQMEIDLDEDDIEMKEVYGDYIQMEH